MNSPLGRPKWIAMLLLHIPLYLVTSYVVRELLRMCFTIVIKAGGDLPPMLLQQHFLVFSIVAGFLAGLLGVLTIRAMLLLPIDFRPPIEPAWKRPQAWIWIISTCWFAFGVLVWISNMHRSVLSASTLGLSSAIRVFFGGGCDLSNGYPNYLAFDTCMTQLSYTHPWLGTIGYSAAALIPTQWKVRLKHSLDSAGRLEAADEEQVPEHQPRPGEVLD